MNAAGGQIQGMRRRQEDAWRVDRWGERELLGIVADGLGGHPGGDVASTAAAAAFGRRFAFAREEGGTPADWLRSALRAADLELRSRTRQEPALRGMATTLVALYLRDDAFWAVSVGDSYVLQLRGEDFACLNELHAENGGVTSCVGYNLSRVDLIDRRALDPGDRFLLASDGIASLPGDALGARLAAAADPAAAVQELLAAIEEQAIPSQDNATIVAIYT